MKTLPETFNRENWTYTLLKHNDFAALYEMSRGHETYREYEVWKLRRYKSDNAFTGIEAGDIKPPSTTEWGRYGWSYARLELAERKFAQLTDEMSKTQHTE